MHATALAAGLSALLVASATAYTTVKLAGAAYLVFLGVQSLRQARRAAGAVSAAPAKKSGNAYLQGLISTVLNPKPALFFCCLDRARVAGRHGAVKRRKVNRSVSR